MSRSLSILDQIKVKKRDYSDQDQEGWLVSYADLITLLFVFFAVLLSISSVSKSKLELLRHEINQEAISSLSELKQGLDDEIESQNLSDKVVTQMTHDGLQVQFNERVLFASGDAKLSAEGSSVMKNFCSILAGIKGKFHMAVEGHTDSRPIRTSAFPSNWSLSAARAVNVLHFLAENGVDEKRMMVRAYADTRPLGQNTMPSAPLGGSSTGDTDAKSRRVILLVF
jgi:chemotaxis protein MotB